MMILKSIWFTEMGSRRPIGMIFYENAEGEKQIFIGTGNGISEAADSLIISQKGAKVYAYVGQEILDHFQKASDG